jgi:tetratricopeptide (TPR) repeat protein
MRQKRRETRRERSARLAATPKAAEKFAADEVEPRRYLTVIGVAIILAAIVIIYGQTIRVPTIDYEDSFYLVRSNYVNVTPAFSRLNAVWNEPYFANFHPVTTTTWLIDRAFGDRSKLFDSEPFRITHLLYAVIGAALLIPLYRRLGIPPLLALLGAVVYAVHPIHTEVIAWLSARKDLTSLIFILLSVLAWLRARTATIPNQWRMRYALAILFALLAVLSKPVAVILPPLFIAYEFCSGPHAGILAARDPLVRRTLALTGIFLLVGGGSTAIFRGLLAGDPQHGGWLMFVPLVLLLGMVAVAPKGTDIAAFLEGNAGLRVIGPPFAVLSVVFGAGSAWTFWAQQQVGAIKAGTGLVRTINLTFDAMLSYAGKAFFPARMTASYNWSEFPNLSVRGLLGAIVTCAILWIAIRLAGSADRNRRLIAFGIFWYAIALLPVSNLVPTSTKMADRYLLVPTAGSILVLLALGATLSSTSRRNQLVVCSVLVLMAAGYTAWAYDRTEVWCGKTTRWKETPHPDLSLWTAAVNVNPDDSHALTNLAITYLRLVPPETDKALEFLNRALQLNEATRMTADSLYESLGDAYFARANESAGVQIGSESWPTRKAAYGNAIRFYRLASQTPSGFTSDDARVLGRLAQSDEGQAVLDAQQLPAATPEQRGALSQERDELRRESESSMKRARELLVAANVSAQDPNYQTVILGLGDIIFGREVGATDAEKRRYYHEALDRYQEAAALLPGDPRPFLYQGICFERLTAIAASPDEKRQDLAAGEAMLRRALTQNIDSPDYSQVMPYRELAVLYTHVNDYGSALEMLKKAQALSVGGTESASLERDIGIVEQFLAERGARK